MLDRITAAAAETHFDFREHAAPHDPLRHRFEEWVPYYRTKFAIAQVLAPRTILEIGVRYGYSAQAFLAAAPGARYLGLDSDSDTFGGSPGAIEWARARLAGRDAEVRVADTQRLHRLPGDDWDLVHIDGQQDGDGTFHDLGLALDCARWVLLDGLFWSAQNMLSATMFLERYRDRIGGAYIIPGYAGELLIESRKGRALRSDGATHEALRDAYTSDYFLADCGGHESFRAYQGRRLVEPRQLVLHELGSPRRGMRVLDVGSGRGELCYAAWQSGAEVVGIDYAADAVSIARRTYAASLGDRLRFVEGDALEYEDAAGFDVIYAADVVEHLAPAALDELLRKLTAWLRPGGRLLVHTWPNRLAYERQHRSRRAAAIAAGLYLPRSPRSRYEELMHINEQTPASLRRALRRSFPAVEIGLARSAVPFEVVRAVADRQVLGTHDSLYAVAGSGVVGASFSALRQAALEPASVAPVSLRAEIPLAMRTAEDVEVPVHVDNRSGVRIGAFPPSPVNLSYRWYRDDEVVVADGIRTPLLPSLPAGTDRTYAATVRTPSEPGTYRLVVTLVQEGRFWFDSLSSSTSDAANVTVEPATE